MSDYFNDWIENLSAGRGQSLRPPPMSPLCSTWITPGRVRVDGEWLLYSDTWGGREIKADNTARLLPDFLELVDKEGDALSNAVFEYAERWGVLGLCGHDLPWSHNLKINEYDLGLLFCGSGCGFPLREGWRAERVSRWLHYATEKNTMHPAI